MKERIEIVIEERVEKKEGSSATQYLNELSNNNKNNKNNNNNINQFIKKPIKKIFKKLINNKNNNNNKASATSVVYNWIQSNVMIKFPLLMFL